MNSPKETHGSWPAHHSELRVPVVASGEITSGRERPTALSRPQLYRHADTSALNFATTAELTPLGGLVGQQRALAAPQFGTRIHKPGFNLFVIGSASAGRLDLRQQFRRAASANRHSVAAGHGDDAARCNATAGPADFEEDNLGCRSAARTDFHLVRSPRRHKRAHPA